MARKTVPVPFGARTRISSTFSQFVDILYIYSTSNGDTVHSVKHAHLQMDFRRHEFVSREYLCAMMIMGYVLDFFFPG